MQSHSLRKEREKLNKSQSLLSYQQSVWNHITHTQYYNKIKRSPRAEELCARDECHHQSA